MITTLLAFANVGVWIAVLSLADPALWRDAYRTYGFVPAEFNFAALPTSLFLHSGLMHLASNVYLLVVFGRVVEGAWGALSFAALYFGGGILGGAAHGAVYPDSTLPLVGASGAIAAIMGAVAVAFPDTRINLLAFAGPMFAVGMPRVEASAITVLLVWFVYQTIMFVNAAEAEGVAWTVHVVGFAAGAIGAGLRGRQRAGASQAAEEEEF